MSDTSTDRATLDASFQGTTIRPGDRDYDTARAIYNGSIDRRPALIVRPHGTADVVDAVTYAREPGCRCRCAAAATASPARRWSTAGS